MTLNSSEQQQQSEEPPLLPFILAEHMSEVIYADLLGKLLVFDSNLHEVPGLWRAQHRYLENLSRGMHQFNMPELQDQFIGSLFEFIRCGNGQIR